MHCRKVMAALLRQRDRERERERVWRYWVCILSSDGW